MNMDSQWCKQQACFVRATEVWPAVNHTTSVTFVNAFNDRSVLHGQVNLAAVNQICVFNEVLNDCKYLKIH